MYKAGQQQVFQGWKLIKACLVTNRQSLTGIQLTDVSMSHAQERSGELGWVPLMSGRWCRWPLQVLIAGHPERNWAPLEWSSLSTVHHDLLELLPNLDHAISWSLFFKFLNFNIIILNILIIEMGEGVEIEQDCLLSAVVTVFITWIVVVLAKPRNLNKGKGKGRGKGKCAARDGGGYTSFLSGWHEETQRSVAQINN